MKPESSPGVGRGWPEALGLVLGGTWADCAQRGFRVGHHLTGWEKEVNASSHSVQPLAPGLGFIGLGKREALV